MSSSGPGQALASDGSLPPQPQDDGPYVLQTLMGDVPLSGDNDATDVKINCVEYWDQNLYVGTSASELLHFVKIPPEPNDKAGQPTYILASRLNPSGTDAQAAPAGAQPGVQQILLLPRVGKACILCNWRVSFYTLPELSPVPGNSKNCNWIGGVDLNESLDADEGTDRGTIMLLSTNQRIQVVRVDDEARAIKRIGFGGTTLFVRRGTVACVADGATYSLLDIDRQLRIPLMSISSLDEDAPPEDPGTTQTLSAESAGGISRSASSAAARPSLMSLGHSRSTSLGGTGLKSKDGDDGSLLSASPMATPLSPRPEGANLVAPSGPQKSLPDVPSRSGTPSQAEQRTRTSPAFLKPHIASPSAEEFLVVIGKSPRDPGIGMFVNLDGDATRPPLEFARYPKELVVDASGREAALSHPRPDEEEAYAIASMTREFADVVRNGLEIQPLSVGEGHPQKYWLEAQGVARNAAYGVRAMTGSEETSFDDIVTRLCQSRYAPFSNGTLTPSVSLKSLDSRTASSMERLSKERELFDTNSDSGDSLPDGWEAARNQEEEEFVRRLSRTESRLAVWAGDQIWWAVRNPLIMQLDARLAKACSHRYDNPEGFDKRAILALLTSLRDRESKTELEFLTTVYMQQKAGMLLLMNLLSPGTQSDLTDAELSSLDELLVDSKLDSRVVLSLVPGVRNEIIEGRRGIWIYGGIKHAAGAYLQSADFVKRAKDPVSSLQPRILHFLRRFLSSWRKMKGFGSVAGEQEVFRTVDAALLLVLLELDRHSAKGIHHRNPIRAELYDVVDKGVECFDRAVDLLGSYHRLYVLSRLYQSRKMAGDVLATWKRIVEGEQDDGQELQDGEARVKEYLAKISSQALVREYGVWLANRNPRLGVQVFAEDRGRAPRFEHAEVVDILKEEAPDAVKYYLEHLVFGKGHKSYVSDLIAYYQDLVVSVVAASQARQDSIAATYEAYRSLKAPKPTYRHFLEDNMPPDDEVWRSRLRLIQLLGGSQDYDAASIREKMAGVPKDLFVPEAIILAGRERRHEVALRLLVHRLGDYDAAVSYCLRGGYSADVAPDGQPPAEVPTTFEEQRDLFRAVLGEFFAIEDAEEQLEQTGLLLERFGGWYEVDDVLALLPDDWPVETVAGFLVGALRRLVAEKRESAVRRALSGSENLRIAYDLVVGMSEKGPTIEEERNEDEGFEEEQ